MKNRLSRKKINPSEHIYTGLQHEKDIDIQLYKYNNDHLSENSSFKLESFDTFKETDYQYWLNVHGLHETKAIQSICMQIGVHDLIIQDILDINQRPKFQEFEKYWFFTLKSIITENNGVFKQEHLSFILGENFLISFQEKKADHFSHIRKRIRNKVGVVRNKSSDYLLYLLLEAILDNYFKTLSEIEDKLDIVDVIDVEADPSPLTLKKIELHKRQIHQIKKTIIPIKEFVTRIEREKFGLIKDQNIKYYYELRDLCLTLLDECAHIEIRLESSINLFFSIQGHRMNQVMKILTVVSTIFIPLTFIAGIYGMNFQNMPELGWKWGYTFTWGIMISIFISMAIYFKRKKWY